MLSRPRSRLGVLSPRYYSFPKYFPRRPWLVLPKVPFGSSVARTMGYRDYKRFAPDTLHHLYNRGNAKMDIFLDEQDYKAFLLRLELLLGRKETPKGTLGRASRLRLTPCPTDAFSVLCYCLMPNHWHLIVEQRTELPISSLLLKVSTSYAKYFNAKYARVGHVFQDQFCGVMIEDDRQLCATSAYVHLNPKVGGLVDELVDWEYSSYPAYALSRPDALCDQAIVMANFSDRAEYRDFVKSRYEDIRESKRITDEFLFR